MSRPVARILSAIAGSAVLGLANAQTPAVTTVFDSLDKNADGKVSLAEASSDDELFVVFKNLDMDKNGELSKEEFAAFQRKRRAS
jgi:Ca2+-binding EF-hand superfamily protein